MIIKHLMPVARHSAALFMLLGFRCFKNLTGTYIFFVQMRQKSGFKTKKSSGACVFIEFIYLKFFFLFCSCDF